MKTATTVLLALALVPAALALPREALAQTPTDLTIIGLQIRAGGRFDNVRKCVATPAGTRGGPAADVSLFMEFGLDPDLSLVVVVPLFRPIFFAAAFHMLQFEPEVGLNFHMRGNDDLDVYFGPTLGLTFHYGPDYNSERSGPGRTASFFAFGPSFGLSLGMTFLRPGETFDGQLGIHPYVTTLFGVGDPARHQGVVFGGMLEGNLRFSIAGE
jgi:hypothetical protein